MSKKHDLVHDDLFIVAAYENFAKATLLRESYQVHQLVEPLSLSKDQKKRPIHFSAIISKEHKDSFVLKERTIGMYELLQPEYIEKIGLSSGEVYSLKKCSAMRNNIHFGGPKSYSYETKFYQGISMLRDRISN